MIWTTPGAPNRRWNAAAPRRTVIPAKPACGGALMRPFTLCVLLCILCGCAANDKPTAAQPDKEPVMSLGNFSVSLAVKDIAASRAFYEKLGFEVVAGDQSQNWLVLSNGDARVGIFQGMFERNMLTFNPGWDSEKNTLAEFDDVREIQRRLKARGLSLTMEADESTTGPAYLMLADPDGNPILIDQHVDRPGT